MSEEIKVRAYQQGDESSIVELLELVFQGWPHIDLECSSLEHWYWKYFGSHIKKQYISVATSRGDIIGCHHSIAFNLRINNKPRFCTTSFDYAVHPDFQRQGVSKKMGQTFSIDWRRRDGVYIDYHITGNPILIKSFSRRKPRFPHDIVNLVWINDIDRQLEAYPMDKSWLIRLGYPTLKFMNILKTKLSSGKLDSDKIEIQEITMFNERVSSFSNHTEASNDFLITRSIDYLNGRYCDPRGGDFVVKLAVENDEALGYIVLKINRYQEYPVGFIVDLLALSGRFDVVEALLLSAMSFFESRDVNLINYQVVKGHPYTDVFEKIGFLDSRLSIHLFYDTLAGDQTIAEMNKVNPKKVHICWGDHDVLPVKMPKY